MTTATPTKRKRRRRSRRRPKGVPIARPNSMRQDQVAKNNTYIEIETEGYSYCIYISRRKGPKNITLPGYAVYYVHDISDPKTRQFIGVLNQSTGIVALNSQSEVSDQSKITYVIGGAFSHIWASRMLPEGMKVKQLKGI